MTSPTFKQAAYASETDEVFIALLTITSDELTEPIYISSDPYEKLTGLGDDVYGCISNGNTFIFMPFDISLPRDDKTGTVSAKLAIENVDRRIVENVRSITKPVNVKIQCVLSNDVDFIEIEYDNLKLSNVNYDVMTVEGDLTFDYWGLEPFPSGRFTPSGFPGLF
jgi:hypothetical protein